MALSSAVSPKGAGGEQPGARDEHAYEVAGHGVKSVNFVGNEKELFSHVRRRANDGSMFVCGDYATFQILIRGRGARRLDYRLAVVQPGISEQQLTADSASVLGADDELVQSLGALPLLVLASAQA